MEYRSKYASWVSLPDERGSGEEVQIHCPFHEDKVASMSINLETGPFKCFGCPAEGNYEQFIKRMRDQMPAKKKGKFEILPDGGCSR